MLPSFIRLTLAFLAGCFCTFLWFKADVLLSKFSLLSKEIDSVVVPSEMAQSRPQLNVNLGKANHDYARPAEPLSGADVDVQSLRGYQVLLQQNHYEQALHIYAEQLRYGNAADYFERTYSYLLDLLKQEPTQSKFLAERWLEVDYGNFYFNYLALRSDFEMAHDSDALERLILLLQNTIPETYLDGIASYQKAIIFRHAERLLMSRDAQALQQLIDQLYRLGEQDYRVRLTTRLKQLERSDYLAGLYPMSIQLKPHGQHHLVTVLINGTVSLDLLLDTGATSVALSRSALAHFHAELKQKDILIHTANGQSSADVLEVASFNVGGVELTDFEITSLDNYPSQQSSGLLGQSFLSLFDWKLDQDAHILYLAPK